MSSLLEAPHGGAWRQRMQRQRLDLFPRAQGRGLELGSHCLPTAGDTGRALALRAGLGGETSNISPQRGGSRGPYNTQHQSEVHRTGHRRPGPNDFGPGKSRPGIEEGTWGAAA